MCAWREGWLALATIGVQNACPSEHGPPETVPGPTRDIGLCTRDMACARAGRRGEAAQGRLSWTNSLSGTSDGLGQASGWGERAHEQFAPWLSQQATIAPNSPTCQTCMQLHPWSGRRGAPHRVGASFAASASASSTEDNFEVTLGRRQRAPRCDGAFPPAWDRVRSPMCSVPQIPRRPSLFATQTIQWAVGSGGTLAPNFGGK